MEDENKFFVDEHFNKLTPLNIFDYIKTKLFDIN